MVSTGRLDGDKDIRRWLDLLTQGQGLVSCIKGRKKAWIREDDSSAELQLSAQLVSFPDCLLEQEWR